MKVLNIGVIGFGFHGKTIVQAVKLSKSLKTVAVLDPDQKKKEEINKFGIKYHENIESFLGNKSVQAVVVASPVSTHLAMVKCIAEAGLPIELEKPMAVKFEEVNEIMSIISGTKVPFMVGMTTHYRPEMIRAWNLVRSGIIGPIRTIHEEIVIGLNSFPMNYVVKENHGGVLLENGIHMIDHCLWFGGKLSKILSASVGNGFLNGFHEDTAFIHAVHSNGVVSLGHLQWMPYKEAGGFCLKLYGDKGMIEVRGLDGLRLNSDGESMYITCYEDGGDYIDNFASRHLPGVVNQLEDFAKFVNFGKKPEVPVDDVIDAHFWLDKVWESVSNL